MNIKKELPYIVIFIFLIAATIIARYLYMQKTKPEANSAVATLPGIDTLIPEGYVLVPLPLVKSKSFESFTKGFAIIDLYNKHQKPVLKSIKLIQAPYDKTVFAVLVRENQSTKIKLSEGPFHAFLKSPNAEPSVAKKLPKTRRSRIIYQDQD